MSCSAGRQRLAPRQRNCAGRSRSWLSGWPGSRSSCRLVTAREVVDEVLDRAAAEVSPAPGRAEAAAPAGPGRRPAVIGVLTVPPWQAGTGADVLPQDYRDLVEVAEDAGRPLRAAQFAAAAGLSTDRAKVETLRSKLKRLADRGWLAESAGPGLFGLPARNGSGLGETVKPG